MEQEEAERSSQLSSADAIKQAVDFNSGKYSTIGALGSFINNSKFM